MLIINSLMVIFLTYEIIKIFIPMLENEIMPKFPKEMAAYVEVDADIRVAKMEKDPKFQKWAKSTARWFLFFQIFTLIYYITLAAMVFTFNPMYIVSGVGIFVLSKIKSKLSPKALTIRLDGILSVFFLLLPLIMG